MNHAATSSQTGSVNLIERFLGRIRRVTLQDEGAICKHMW